MCYFAPFVKRGLFLPIQASPEGRTHLEWVSNYWCPLQTPSAHRAFGSVTSPSTLLEERPILYKRKCSFSLQNSYGLVFFHWGVWVYFGCFKLQTSWFCHLWNYYVGLYHTSFAMCCFALFGNIATSPNKSSFSRKNIFAGGSGYWGPLHTPHSYRVFGSVMPPSTL